MLFSILRFQCRMLFFLFSLLCSTLFLFFFFNDTATTEIYTLSLHDALPILPGCAGQRRAVPHARRDPSHRRVDQRMRSEEHTSELQSRLHLVCRLLLEKKKNKIMRTRESVTAE